MSPFREQHPNNLIERLFMLENLRKLDIKQVHAKAVQPEKVFFKYIVEVDGEDVEHLDYNWEFLFFVATHHQVERLMEPFLDELDKLNEEEMSILRKKQAAKIAQSKTLSVNLMDIANEDMKNSGKILDKDGNTIS